MKINYSFVAQTPLFTGSDESSGIVRTLRREKVLLKNPITFESNFSNDIERRKALMDIIFPIYASISQKLKSDNYGFYEAYSNKVKAACASKDKFQFLNKLVESCSIVTVPDGLSKLLKTAIDKFSDVELIETVRNEHHYLMILLREYVAKQRDYRNNKDIQENTDFENTLFADLFPKQQKEEVKEVEIKAIKFEKKFDNVPYFGGNSIRGYLRRLIMNDFCKQVGITKLNKSIYHQLFTGGNITESTGTEDIEHREKYIDMCPPIGLLGSAIGNMTIEGEMKVMGARLRCLEHNTGNCTFWELVELNFGTRHDDSKTEKDIDINVEFDKKGKEKEAPKTQMYYQYENFVTGTVFDSSFILTTDNDLLISVFWRMIKCWKENNFIGGNSARDAGMIDINIEIPENSDKLYLDYLQEHKSEILKYFGNA
jgi:hypothetical protein